MTSEQLLVNMLFSTIYILYKTAYESLNLILLQ